MDEKVREILDLIEEEKVNSAIDKIQMYLSDEEVTDDFIEGFINNLNAINDNSPVVLKTILPNLLKLMTIKNDVMRYSLLLTIKSLAEENPDLLVPFAREYLCHKNANAREGMLRLLTYAAKADPEEIRPLMEDIINLLADKEDFVQNEAIDLLKVLGRKYRLEIEKQLIDFVKSTTDPTIIENAETVLKKLVDIKDLEEDDVHKKQLEAVQKILEEKEKEITEEEIKIKQDEIKKREELVNIKKETKVKDEELQNKEKELLEKEQKLKEKELKLKETALLVEEKEKEIEEEKIRQKAEQLEKEIEINRKKAELELVKKELEMKDLEEQKREILEKEKKRIERRINKIEELDGEEEYDSLKPPTSEINKDEDITEE
ncbi:MAG: hypothetical protein GF364_09885 [Candidatus Lokiarchaeota archaeon]|nr:hypothetical protein [Candidatus Lokiarchaeota archaeon]